MKNLLVVAGTRPEIIKLAPVVLKARDAYKDTFSLSLCLTGQHQSMAREALSIFRIEPDTNLDIMQPGQTLNQIAQAVFERLPAVIDSVLPDVLMVQGDTTTAAMAAFCGFNRNIPVAHVEAGLRSFNLSAPYPEEANRRVINSFARYNFCPTQAARQNLSNEQVSQDRLFVTGNTIVDAVRMIEGRFSLDDPGAVDPRIQTPFILVTAHRRESFGEGFRNLCDAIRRCAEELPGHQFVYPVHLNPNVQAPVYDALSHLPNMVLMKPVPYLQLLTLLKTCLFVLTDSGGIQEEAPSFGKYCIVLRDVTERMESVHLGISELVGMNTQRIVEATTTQVRSPKLVSRQENPYGDGLASDRILQALV